MAKINPNELCPCQSGLLFKDCHGPKVRQLKTPTITQTVELKIIPEPDPNTRTVFIYDGEGTICFSGYEVGLELVCGSCESQLVIGIPKANIENIVIRCKNCGNYNEV